MGLARRMRQKIQNTLAQRGVYLSVHRRSLALGVPSPTFKPLLINHAQFMPFLQPDKWSQLYFDAQDVTRGADTDNLWRQCHFYSTFQLAEYAATLPEGDVVECGCWHGHSTVAIARILAEHDFAGEFHVFDSFEGGLSDFKPEDNSILNPSDATKQHMLKHFASSYPFVKSVTDEYGFVHLHKGWIPDVFADFTPRPLRFVHVDVDMFEPTMASLKFFWSNLVDGGVMVCDDYNAVFFAGANRAVDQFLTEIEPPKLVYRPPLGSIVLMK